MHKTDNDRDSLVSRTGDREYKDNLFTDYLGRDHRALHVYSALTGNQYDDADMEIFKLGSVMYRDLYNDLSFVIGGKLVVFFEGQSSVNPNMPVRLLEYLSRYYEDYTKRNENGSIFSGKLVRLPKPEFIVFYNGRHKQENEIEYKLSDAFEQVETLTNIELTVKVFNINYDANVELLAKSKELHDYAALVHKVRKYLIGELSLEHAISHAIKDCIEEGIMVTYLRERREETYSMLFTQFVVDEQIKAARNDERSALEERIQAAREDGKEEGRVEERAALEERIHAARDDGKREERKEIVESPTETAKILKLQGVSAEIISQATGLSAEDIQIL
jgi:predicted transposase YdaD